jgi:hypothetical protein
MTLEERIAKLEEEMYRQEFWQRPAPPPRVYPQTEATECDWFDEPTAMVHVTFDYSCGVCGEQFHDAIRVPNHEPNPFSRLLPCLKTKLPEHLTKVVFRREKRSLWRSTSRKQPLVPLTSAVALKEETS